MLGRFLPQWQAVEGTLSAIFDSIQLADGAYAKKQELRASAFPLCPLVLLDSLLKPVEREVNQHHGRYHTFVGHTAHAYAQNGTGRASNKVYGNWKCRLCGYVTPNPRSFPDEPCPQCGQQHVDDDGESLLGGSVWDYHELDFMLERYGVRLSAHLDGLLLDAATVDKLPEEFVPGVEKTFKLAILDYKTCSLADASKLPVKKHLLQLAVYVVLLEQHYNMCVDYISLLYIPKDKPGKRKEFQLILTDELVAAANSMIDLTMQGYAVFQKIAEQDAAGQRDPKQLGEMLRELYSFRLCGQHAPDQQPIEFYTKEVKPFFFGGEEDFRTGKVSYKYGCPLVNRCMQSANWHNASLSELLYGSRKTSKERRESLVAGRKATPSYPTLTKPKK